MHVAFTAVDLIDWCDPRKIDSSSIQVLEKLIVRNANHANAP